MDSADTPCVFCEIVAGRAEASVAYADEIAIAFMDINPITPGHTLVVPRVHAKGLEDLEEDTGAHLWRVGQRIARALRRSGLRCEGVNFFLADDEAAFHEVFHVHLHVIPRYAGDGFVLSADWRARDRALLDQEAAALRAALANPAS